MTLRKDFRVPQPNRWVDPDAIGRRAGAMLVVQAEVLAQTLELDRSHGALGLLAEAYATAITQAAGPSATPGQQAGLIKIAQRMLGRQLEDVFSSSVTPPPLKTVPEPGGDEAMIRSAEELERELGRGRSVALQGLFEGEGFRLVMADTDEAVNRRALAICLRDGKAVPIDTDLVGEPFRFAAPSAVYKGNS